MKGKRILTALIAAALTAGVTYAYTKPAQDRNQIAFWRTADGTQVDAYNIYGQPVTTYYFPSSNQPPNVIVRNAYDRDGNRLRTSRTLADGAVDLELRWTYDREGRVLSQTQTQGQDQLVTTYAYELGAQGRVVRIEEICEGQSQSTICKTYADAPDSGWCETAVYEGMGILDIGGDVNPLSLLTPEACLRFRRSKPSMTQGVVQKITVLDDLGARTWVYAYNEQGQPAEIVEQLDGQPVGWMTLDYDADGMMANVVLDGTFGPRTVVFQETNPIFA
ncbi:MAG: hypothetical protein ACLUB2_01785 [Butyricicoccus pullicaecorum]